VPRYRFEELVNNITEKGMPAPGDEKWYIGLEHLDSGSLSVTRWGGDVELTGQKLVMKKGDILFGRRNTYLRRVAIAPHDGYFSAHGMIFRAREEHILPEYLPFFIASDYFMDAAIRISVGSLSPTVNWKTLKELEFEIPEIEEQRKSAALLWAVENTKRAYEELLKQSDELVKSQFIELFGDPNDRLHGTWPIKPFREITISFDKYRKPVKEGDRKAMRGQYPYYGATGIVDYVNDYKLEGTFLLISEDGKALEFRNYDIAFIASGKIWVNNHAHVVQCTDDIDMVFLMRHFKYMDISQWVTGTDQKKLNKDNLDSIPIMVPPIALQQQYVAIVQQLDKSKFSVQIAIYRDVWRHGIQPKRVETKHSRC